MHFSLTRLLLAVTTFATAFGAFSYLGFAGIAVSILIGVSVGAICLIVKPDQIWPMVRTGMITILGGFIGLMFCPMVHPPYNLSLIHISEPTRLRRISYAVFCLKKKK